MGRQAGQLTVARRGFANFAGVRVFAYCAQLSRAKAQQHFTERSSALGLAEMTHSGLFDLGKKSRIP